MDNVTFLLPKTPLDKDLMEMNPGRVESLTPARFGRRVTECEMWLHSLD